MGAPGSAADELRHLREWVFKVPDPHRKRMVAHRGFHGVAGEIDRPIENTLPAFEQAWTAGIVYCECDVFVTKDGHIVLNHDDDTQRLQLLAEAAPRPVTSMTLAELVALPMRGGCRCPTLSEVLRVAEVLTLAGTTSKLVIELKTHDTDVARPLAQWFHENPWAVAVTGVVMSFDVELLHTFVAELRSRGLRDGFPAPIMLLTTETDFGPGPWVRVLLGEEGALDGLEATLRGGSEGGDHGLDGVYVEGSEGLLAKHTPELRRLAERYRAVGVWLNEGDPDTAGNLQRYCDAGVKFVNTDLPRDFLAA